MLGRYSLVASGVGGKFQCCLSIGEVGDVFWLSRSQHTPPPLRLMPNELSQMSSGPSSSVLFLLLYI